MVLVVLALIVVACLSAYWWLGKTATPGQQAMEERWRANKGLLRRSVASVPGIFGRMAAGRAHRDADWWSRDPERQAIPEPEEHKEPWRDR